MRECKCKSVEISYANTLPARAKDEVSRFCIGRFDPYFSGFKEVFYEGRPVYRNWENDAGMHYWAAAKAMPSLLSVYWEPT